MRFATPTSKRIVWYRDDDDYVVLRKEHYKGAEPAAQMVREEKVDNKIISKVPHHTPYNDEQFSLRLIVQNTTFTGQYRKTEKEDWKSFASEKNGTRGRGLPQ